MANLVSICVLWVQPTLINVLYSLEFNEVFYEEFSANSNPLLSAVLQVFNFTLGVKVEQNNQLLGKAEQDMTKLCNHRRKVVAMAALCRSIQASQLPFANLHFPGKFECI